LITECPTFLDGYINGIEVKDVFLQTGLQPMTLAHIWNLCDTYNSGRLNNEQFALAMHFVNKKVENGIEPPMSLQPEMVPPSCRPKQTPEVNEPFLETRKQVSSR
jgi:epidermal growth factor receptor substrate 15